MRLRPYLIDFSRLIVADFLRSDVVNKTLAELLALKELQRWQTASQHLSRQRRLAADPDLVAAIAASAEQVPITHDDADDHLAAAIAASAEPLPIIHDDGSVHWQGTEDDGGRGAAVGSADLVVAEPALDEGQEEQEEAKPGKVIGGGKYEVSHIIGKGAYSSVWAGRCKRTGKNVAIKHIDRVFQVCSCSGRRRRRSAAATTQPLLLFAAAAPN